MSNHSVRFWLFGLCSLLLVACTSLPGMPQPPPVATVPPGNELPYPLSVPSGYRISLYAEGLEEARSVVFSPDGTPYVTVMNRAEPNTGKVLALPDANRDGRADKVVLVDSGLNRPHGIAFHEGVLYVSDNGSLFRLFDDTGDRVADRRELVVTGMPTSDDHGARPFVFDAEGKLLVIIGSSCNACQEGDKQRATLLRFDPTQQTEYPGDTVYARGLRSVVDLVWRPGTEQLWATNNARDFLGAQEPPDQLFRIEEGKHYGWPYCYGDRVPDAEIVAAPNVVTPDGSSKEQFCATQVTSPAALLPPHAAPLGLAFYDGTQFPAAMRGQLFVAYHGAYDLSNNNGYRVVRIPFTGDQPGTPEDFVTGFRLPDAPKWLGRPVDIAVGPEGSLYITDDVNGYLFRVDYVGG